MRKSERKKKWVFFNLQANKTMIVLLQFGNNKPACPAQDTHPALPARVCFTPVRAGLWILYTGHIEVNYPRSK